jgi:hypothetical protein
MERSQLFDLMGVAAPFPGRLLPGQDKATDARPLKLDEPSYPSDGKERWSRPE